MSAPRLVFREAANQEEALVLLAEQSRASVVEPRVRKAAMQITQDVPNRDFMGELRAIYNAVKHGDPRVEGLSKGVRYVADPVQSDYFTAPHVTLMNCDDGACAGDCDDASALVAALAGALGFRACLRAYGPSPNQGDIYDHVYAVVGGPDKNSPEQWLGMDTTVDEADVGWEPPPGHVLSAEITLPTASFQLFEGY